MNDPKPYWFLLIQYWINNKGRTGLTIPFLIGAAQIVDNNKSKYSVKTFLKEVRNSNVEKICINLL
jgi:hypothetical protein